MVKNVSGTCLITGINIVSNTKIPNTVTYLERDPEIQFCLTSIVENCISVTKSKNVSITALVVLNEYFPVSWGLLAQL